MELRVEHLSSESLHNAEELYKDGLEKLPIFVQENVNIFKEKYQKNPNISLEQISKIKTMVYVKVITQFFKDYGLRPVCWSSDVISLTKKVNNDIDNQVNEIFGREPYQSPY